MTWIGVQSFVRRPLLFVEDRLYHIDELLAALAHADPELASWTTIACLDRPGPDTDRRIGSWLEAHRSLQVMAAAAKEAVDPALRPRFRPLDAASFESMGRMCVSLAGALRPGGLLLQDVQLETLPFLPADRWWESIVLANAVRGMFSDRPPLCRFISNKRNFTATFGRDLLDAGFDPRDVMDKRELREVIVPVAREALRRMFPLRLSVCDHGVLPPVPVALGAPERAEIERELDLILWEPGEGGAELCGRILDPARPRFALHTAPQEARTWERLFAAAFASEPGVAVLEVGGRLAGPDSARAEQSNAAARHVHTLRGRVIDETSIVTAQHAYRLNPRLRLGWVREA
jgi:hypothetical protein